MTIAQDVEPRTVEVRCPVPREWPDGRCDPGHLFFRMRLAGEQPQFVHPDNLIELACYDCKKRLAKSGIVVKRVLHRYDMLGQLVETLTQESAEA